MRVVCISDFVNGLTKGGIYEVKGTPGDVYYNLYRSDGQIDLYNKSWFITLEEYRRQKIDEILSGRK